jgi:hypothetical protein
MDRNDEFSHGSGKPVHKLSWKSGDYYITAGCSCGTFAVMRTAHRRGGRTSTRDNIKWLHSKHKDGTLEPSYGNWHDPSKIGKGPE